MQSSGKDSVPLGSSRLCPTSLDWFLRDLFHTSFIRFPLKVMTCLASVEQSLLCAKVPCWGDTLGPLRLHMCGREGGRRASSYTEIYFDGSEWHPFKGCHCYRIVHMAYMVSFCSDCLEWLFQTKEAPVAVAIWRQLGPSVFLACPEPTFGPVVQFRCCSQGLKGV